MTFEDLAAIRQKYLDPAVVYIGLSDDAQETIRALCDEVERCYAFIEKIGQAVDDLSAGVDRLGLAHSLVHPDRQGAEE